MRQSQSAQSVKFINILITSFTQDWIPTMWCSPQHLLQEQSLLAEREMPDIVSVASNPQ